MKEIKREYLPLYSFYDRSGIAKHLEDMAARGWLLEKLSSWCWQYRRIEAKTLHFSVTYFPKATQFAPYPADGLETFWDFCAEAGWVLAADNAQVQVFYNKQEHPVPMGTDPETDLENIHRSMKKSFLSSYWSLVFISLLELGFFLWRLLDDPIDQFSSMIQLNAILGWLPMMLLAAVELARYYRWRKRARTSIETGAPLPELHSARWLTLLIWVMVGIELLVLLISSLQISRGVAFTMVFTLLYMFLMLFLANSVRRAMQHLHFKPWANRLVTYGVIIALTIGMMAGLIALVFKTSGSWFNASEAAETYEYHGITWSVYHNELPLNIQELVPTDYDGWSTQLTRSSSPLLTHMEANQRPRLGDGDLPDLSYEIVIVKAPFLYDLCKNDFIDWLERDNDELPREYWDEYRSVDTAPWDAQEVYQRYSSGEPINQFLICWSDRIAEIHFDWEWTITDEMMSVTAERLKTA